MRAFKKVTSLVLALALVLTSVMTLVAFAETFNDVPSDYQYARAINELVAEGILEGYENDDGSYSFKPENTVTRAEFATIISRASIETVPELTTAAATFADMGTAEISWAVKYVSYAVSRGVINGFPADETGAVTFKPNDPVTYGQAVKMIVCMLGYQNAVAVTDPWYQGYLNIANQLNVTNGAAANGDSPATRGMVAQLISNMLDTRPQVQTGVDQNGNPIYSTSNNTFRDETLQTQTYTGQLLGVFNNTLRDGGYGLSKTEFIVGDQIFQMGTLSADSISRYLGYEVEVTYSESDSTSDLIAKKVTATNRNETYTVDDSNLDVVYADYLEYWASDDDRDTTRLNYDKDNMYIIQNGSPIGVSLTDNQVIELFDVDTGSIQFIDYDSDGSMDVAIVTSYETYVVSQKPSEDDGEYSFFDKFGMTDGGEAIVLDENDDATVVKRVNDSFTSFSDSAPSSIRANDVVSIARSMDGDGIEVIVSGIKKTGKVTEKETNGGKITIGGKEYESSKYYQDVCENHPDQIVSNGDNVTVYLDFMGKIAYVEKTQSAENFGYIMKAGQDDGYGSPVQVQLKRTNNSSPVLTLTDRVKINGKNYDADEVLSELAAGAALVNGNGDDAIWGAAANAEYSSLVQYETNSNGEINAIYTVAGEIGNPDDEDAVANGIGYKYLASSGGKLTYTSSGKAFKQGTKTIFTINSDTVLFVVPNNREDENGYSVKTGSSATAYFRDADDYYVDAYEGESSLMAKYVVVYEAEGDSAQIDATTVPVVITGWSSKTNSNNGEKCYEIRYYELGSSEIQSAQTKDTSALDDAGIQVGDVVRFIEESDGIDEFEVLFSNGELFELMDEKAGSAEYDGRVYEVWQGYSNDEKYFRAYYGTALLSPVETQGKGSMLVTPDLYDGEELNTDITESFDIDNSIDVYVIDADANNSDKVKVSTTDAIVAGDTVSDDAASRVLVITTEADENYVIVYKASN